MRFARWPLWVLAAIVVALALPVSADQWYEHYARAEKALLNGDHATAISELNQALERRGNSGARVRTYGMRVVDYFPYLRLGIAYFEAGDSQAALRAFETEEQLGAIQGSEAALGELTRYRDLANQALERQRAARQQAVDELVVDNLANARALQREGRYEEALTAVDRALALAPDHPVAVELAGALRRELARQDEEDQRAERVSRLIDEGRQLRSDARLAEAASRFRQAAELDPGGAAAQLLAQVQTELARQSEEEAGLDWAGVLDDADELRSREELESALGLVQQVLAAEPGNPRATGLERRLLGDIADRDRSDEISRLMARAEERLAAGDLEAVLTAANLVLARDRGHAEALAVIRDAYTALGRRLLGEGPAQNLPPAIRFATIARDETDDASIPVVKEPFLDLTGVVIDETEVSFTATDGSGAPIPTELSEQSLGGVVITEFSLRVELPLGVSSIVAEAADVEGLSSRSEAWVDYHRPMTRSPWLWSSVVAVVLSLPVVHWVGRRRRRAQLRRRRFNPFVAGPPVRDPGLFVGRDALLDRVLATVPNNSLLLLGERRIGKTSTLEQLRMRLPGLDHPCFCFLPVSVDLQGVPEDAFFATLAEAVGEAVGDPGMAAARAAEGYDSRELFGDLRRVLPTLECPDGRRAKVVLLLDEIDELNGYSHRTNQRLRSLFMRSFADQLVAVAAGVGIAREWEHEGSPWYNFFEELEVGPVDLDAARRLVTAPLAGVIDIDDEAVARILAQADGRPYLIQKIALAAVQRVHEDGRGRITLKDIEIVV